mgnify:CR=1 FL=1
MATMSGNCTLLAEKYIGGIPVHAICKQLRLLIIVFQRIHIRYWFYILALGGAKIFPNFSIVDRNISHTTKYVHSTSTHAKHSCFNILWYSTSDSKEWYEPNFFHKKLAIYWVVSLAILKQPHKTHEEWHKHLEHNQLVKSHITIVWPTKRKDLSSL